VLTSESKAITFQSVNRSGRYENKNKSFERACIVDHPLPLNAAADR
jgi:hypothetical protein